MALPKDKESEKVDSEVVEQAATETPAETETAVPVEETVTTETAPAETAPAETAPTEETPTVEVKPVEGVLIEENPTEEAKEIIEQPAPGSQALAKTNVHGVNPIAELEAQGITNIKLDFSSFPKITLEKGSFSSDDHPNFGSEFEFQYFDKHPSYLLSSEPPDRDTETELVYSNDGKTEASSGKSYEEFINTWKEKGWGFRKTTYDIVIGMATSGPHKDEFVQLQISPTSQGALGGYLYGLGMKKLTVRDITTRCSAGKERGKGTRSFTPWVFKAILPEEPS